MLFVPIVAFSYSHNIPSCMNIIAEFRWHDVSQWPYSTPIATGQQPTHNAKC